jgi:hypothetical protein
MPGGDFAPGFPPATAERIIVGNTGRRQSPTRSRAELRAQGLFSRLLRNGTVLIAVRAVMKILPVDLAARV